jgi:hydroxymethylpyrimidine pyrophosphatase-like HAD family hydrolase
VPVWDEILEPGFDGVIASAGGYVEYEGKVLLHRSLPVEEVRHVVEFFDRHRVECLLESNSGLYGSRRARERLRELIFGGVTDEDILAELEKGPGGFIDSLVIDPDPVRSDINKISFLDSPSASTRSGPSSRGRCTSSTRRCRCSVRTAAKCPFPGSTRRPRSSS